MNQAVLRCEVDETKQGGSARDAAAKGRELYQAMKPSSNLDEGRMSRQRAILQAFQSGNRAAFELVLREERIPAVRREELLKEFDEYQRTSS